MIRFLTLLAFLLISFEASAQFDYRLFKSYSDSSTKKLNSGLRSATEFQSKGNNDWVKTIYQEFNSGGLPVKLIQFNEQGIEVGKKEFKYDSKDYISNIETFKNGKHEQSTEFAVDALGRIISYADYVYSSLHGEKMLVWKTYLEYNLNKTLKKSIKTEGEKKDTTEIDFYDISGQLIKSLWKEPGLRTTKITYAWNKDKTEMKEDHYENDSTIYTTVVHRYKNDREVERIDPSTSSKPFYWKYDNKGRVTETNEAFYYIVSYTYDLNGRMASKTINVLFSDSNEQDLPKKINFKYQYESRN